MCCLAVIAILSSNKTPLRDGQRQRGAETSNGVVTCTKSSKLRVHRGGSVLRPEVRVGRFTELDEMKFPNRVAFFGPALRGSILNEMNFPSLDEMKFPTPGCFFSTKFRTVFCREVPGVG